MWPEVSQHWLLTAVGWGQVLALMSEREDPTTVPAHPVSMWLKGLLLMAVSLGSAAATHPATSPRDSPRPAGRSGPRSCQFSAFTLGLIAEKLCAL